MTNSFPIRIRNHEGLKEVAYHSSCAEGKELSTQYQISSTNFRNEKEIKTFPEE